MRAESYKSCSLNPAVVLYYALHAGGAVVIMLLAIRIRRNATAVMIIEESQNI